MGDITNDIRGIIGRLTGRGGGCSHLDQIADVIPSGDGCAECLEQGMRWVHLRLCLSCGHVGCCEQSEGKHASAHAREADHPIVRSQEPGEDWRWCYVDQLQL